MTDPTAIDLEKYRTRSIHDNAERAALIAAVEALRKRAYNAYSEGWATAHEPAPCGHARANHKDPEFGTPEYKGNEKCEACTEVEELQGQLIYSFTETNDGSPEYTQGNEKIHELHDLVTAEECNGLVKTIKTTEAENARLRKVLENYATSTEELAFEMKPPNSFTPRFVQLAVGLRQASRPVG